MEVKRGRIRKSKSKSKRGRAREKERERENSSQVRSRYCLPPEPLVDAQQLKSMRSN